ncbi:MAG TPA: dockerin type I repeat-containing protein [Streptosporangiaceae bacterium]|nr:dockerin type I repeat-containing protein [Streptosporangiaceae bacterium]
MSAAAAGIGMTGVAWASTPGEACLFSAPYGVIGTGTVGHIGYGFRNGTGNNWTYGATEGGAAPNPSPPSATHSWHATGTWAQMLKTFGGGTQPNWPSGPGYYIDYRCTNVVASNPTAALTQVGVGEINGYDLVYNNCLTKSILILQQYGVPNLPNPVYVTPDTYFSSKLPSYPAYSPGFNRPQWLTSLTVGVNLVDPLSGAYLNTNPLRKTRPMHVQIFNGSNQLVFDSDPNWSNSTNHASSPIRAKVVPGTDKYTATFQLPGTSSNLVRPAGCLVTQCSPNVWSAGGVAGAYLVKVQLDYTLRKYTPGFALISQGIGNSVADTSLTVGDINQDNQVNIADYNMLLQCYSDLSPPPGPCPSWQKTASDLNDDGYVNGIDYNIMLRIFQSQGGA